MKRSLLLLSVALVATLLLPLTPAAAASAQAGSPFTVQNWPGDPSPSEEKPRPPTPASGGTTDRVVVEFSAAADLSRARAVPGWTARGASVADSLQEQSTRAQSDALALVRSRPGARAESFWISNAIVVQGADQSLRDALAALPGVKSVRTERTVPLIEPVDIEAAVTAAAGDPEWGVAKIGAPAAWDQGVLGGGVVVATIDSGVEYSHPAIVGKYRGNKGDGTFDHSYNWYDAVSVCPTQDPCDLYGHGTHTMGTIVGGDGPGPFTPDIGVAPGAQWISASCGPFFCSESQLMRASQFILEPFDKNGENPDPSKRPQLVSNSWGLSPGDPLLMDVVRAWRSAGIIPIFSAGNEGPGCGTTRSPGDFPESFTIGATDINDNIASFSSRGPSFFGGGKPNVAAPGVNVVSSVPGGGYAANSGTSMASPHVAGAFALMLSAAPALKGDVAGATDALARTAIDSLDDSCGADPDGDPNNTFGEGRINAEAAVNLVATGGTLTGTVTDSGRPVGGARVTATNAERTSSTITKPDGTYELLLAAGTYTIRVEAFGYEPAVREGVVIREKETVRLDIALTPAARFKVSGTVVRAENGRPLPDATVEVVGVPVPPATTDASGRYELTVPAGTYTFKASQAGCVAPRTIEIVVRSDQVLDFRLPAKTDRFGHGCSPTTFQWIQARNQTALYGDDSYGRLRLPFAFPFYGQTYQDVFVTTNGALSFVDPQYANSFNTAIPESSTPNAAIYPLWQDLVVDGDAVVSYDTLARGQGGSSFVVSYDKVHVRGSSTAVSFQVRLHQDGTIDVTYDDMAGVNEGAQATIGIEDPTGTDALQFGFRERVARSRTAWRYTEITSATVNGTVLDNNDGQGIAAATVTADPGGRTATTDAQGRYTLKLAPGRYRLTASKPGYESAFTDVRVQARTTLEAPPLRLKAPAATISPSSLALSSTYGQTVEATVTVSNPGSSPLNWSVRDRERVTGRSPAPPPPTFAGAPVIQKPSWGADTTRPAVPVTAVPGGYHAAPTDPIIEDPAGDASGVDVTTVAAGSDTDVVSMNLGFSASSQMSQIVGYVLLDTDQSRATGRPATDFSGKPTQDVGADYYISLWGIHNANPVVDVYRTDTFQLVASPPARIEGQSVLFDVPLSVLGTAEDGNMDTDLILGTFAQPTDWAPDVGHGTVLGTRDAPWLDAQPASGVIAPGGSTTITVRAGGPALLPGSYRAELQFTTNAPRNPNPIVPVTLDVVLPANYGTVEGRVTDARGGAPVKGATVTLQSAGAEPVLSRATTDANGAYRVHGPQGTAKLTVEADKYRSETKDVTITAGATATVDVPLRPLEPIAAIEGAPVELTVTAGSTASGSVSIRNDGLVDLQYEIREREGAPTALTGRSAGPVAGSGQYLYRRAPVPMRANNAAGTATATPSAYRWSPATAADARILVYADDFFHKSPNTYTDQALQRLGLPYTAHYDGDFAGFFSDLASGQWDVVIFANDNYFPEASMAVPLRTYVENGGTLIMHTWAMSFISADPLWGTLGVGFVSDDSPPPDPIHWWDESHPAVTTPEDAPEQLSRQDGRYFYNGQRVTALDGTEAVAGYTEEAAAGEAALVIGNDGRTVFRGLLDGVTDADDDGDSIPDGTELWVNLIEGVQTGFASDVPWLTVTPSTGTVAPGASAPLQVTVDATGLSEGTHVAELFVVTNDPRARVHRVPVQVTVLPAATASGPGSGAPVPAA